MTSAAPADRVRLAMSSVWGLWGVSAVPFVIAAAALHTRDWHPVLDLAMTELRVRDVGTADTPLIGLPGRIGVFPDQGSHPGPLGFYLLAPTYRVLGASAWALLVAAIVLHLAAIGLALWIARRRGGRAAVLVAGAALALLTLGYGFEVLTQPWNPYLPLLFWAVVLLGTWSVLDGDHAMLPVVTAAASLCAQTHVPYLGLGLGMGALCVAGVAHTWVRHPDRRLGLVRWTACSLGVGVLLWLPVVIDQLTATPGNLSMLSDHFRHPPEPPIGVADGLRLMLRHLDLVRAARGLGDGDGFMTRAGFATGGSVLPGLVLLAVWLATAVTAWRAGHRRLSTLNVVGGWAFVLGVVSASRIFGKVWYYLTLWAWAATVLLVVSVVWAAGSLVHRRIVRGTTASASVAAGAVVWLTVSVVAAVSVHAPEQHLSEALAAVVGPTADALDDGLGAARGPQGRYLVTWNDARNFGSTGYGLVNELERRGFDVGVPGTWRVPVTPHRVIATGDASAEVRLATGSYIDRVRGLPGAVTVVEHDPRDARARGEYERLHAAVAEALTSDGNTDLVPLLDTNLFGLQLDPRVPPDVQQIVDRMLRLGGPTAVFILPPGSPL